MHQNFKIYVVFLVVCFAAHWRSGDAQTSCSNLVVNATWETQYFEPFSPEDEVYAPDQDCQFIFVPAAGYENTSTAVIKLTFVDYYQMDSASSCYDYVRVYDGPLATAENEVSEKICGTSLSGINSPVNFISSTNLSLVTFYSSGANNYKGFKLAYQLLDAPESCPENSGTNTWYRSPYNGECYSISNTGGKEQSECKSFCRDSANDTDLVAAETEEEATELKYWLKYYLKPGDVYTSGIKENGLWHWFNTNKSMSATFNAWSTDFWYSSSYPYSYHSAVYFYSSLYYWKSDYGTSSKKCMCEYDSEYPDPIPGECEVITSLVATSQDQHVEPFAPEAQTYVQQQTCAWLIYTSRSGEVIQIEFTDYFDVEVGSPCDDSVKVYGGPTPGHDLIGEFCGSTLPDYTTYTSNSSYMLVVFEANSDATVKKGFNMTYRSVSIETSCPWPTVLHPINLGCYHLSDTSYTFSNAEAYCKDLGEGIELVAAETQEEALVLRYWLDDIVRLSVNVWTSAKKQSDNSWIWSSSGYLLTTARAVWNDGIWYSSYTPSNSYTNVYWYYYYSFKWRASSSTSNSYRALCEYESAAPTNLTAGECPRQTTLTVYDYATTLEPFSPAAQTYLKYLDCYWVLMASEPNQVIELTLISYLDTEDCQDYLAVYDSTQATAETLIGKYCGSLLPSPPTVYSTNSSMTLYFHSDSDSIVKMGFKVSYKLTNMTTCPQDFEQCPYNQGCYHFSTGTKTHSNCKSYCLNRGNDTNLVGVEGEDEYLALKLWFDTVKKPSGEIWTSGVKDGDSWGIWESSNYSMSSSLDSWDNNPWSSLPSSSHDAIKFHESSVDNWKLYSDYSSESKTCLCEYGRYVIENQNEHFVYTSTSLSDSSSVSGFGDAASSYQVTSDISTKDSTSSLQEINGTSTSLYTLYTSPSLKTTDAANSDSTTFQTNTDVHLYTYSSYASITSLPPPPPTTAAPGQCQADSRVTVTNVTQVIETFPTFNTTYLNDQECSWLLQTSTGSGTITINFIDYFDIEPDEVCDYDYIRLYDGSTTFTTPLSPKICGASLPNVTSYTSSGSTLLLYFYSDDSEVGKGFNFSYFMSDEEPLTTTEASTTVSDMMNTTLELNITTTTMPINESATTETITTTTMKDDDVTTTTMPKEVTTDVDTTTKYESVPTTTMGIKVTTLAMADLSSFNFSNMDPNDLLDDSVMNALANPSANTSVEEQQELMNAMLDSLDNLFGDEPLDADTSLKMAGTFGAMAGNSEAVDSAMADKLAGATDKLLDNIGGANMSSDAAASIGAACTGVVGSILGAALSPAPASGNSSNQDSGKSKELVKKAVGMANKVADLVTSSLSPVAPPVIISTPALAMALAVASPATIASKNLSTSEIDFKLPTALQMSGNVALKVSSFATNPYGFAKGGDDINSPMASFNTKAQDGGSLSLGGEQLKGSLKTSSQQNATAVDATNITSESGPTHKYTITSNKTSMFIYMGFPSNSKLILLGKLNAIPGSADFDFKITLINNTANRSEDSGMKVIASYDENDETLRIIILGKQFKATTGYLKIMILTYADPSISSTLSPSARRLLSAGGSGNATGNSTSLSYSVKSLAITPKYYNEATESWETSDELEIDEESTGEKVVFKSNFMGSFAAGLFEPPNTIDFDKVFSNFAALLADNPYVLIVMCTIVGLFLIGIIFARRADIKDNLMWEYGPLIQNQPNDRFHYRISVYTGTKSSKKLTSNVFIMLGGEDGKLKPKVMMDGYRENFKSGTVTNFLLTTDEDIGDLKLIHLWHDSAGPHPNWMLNKVVIFDVYRQKRHFFLCHQWLAVDKDDGSIHRMLPVASEEKLKNFNSLLSGHAVKNLFDEHLWFSVVKRPTPSRLSRVQRLCTCLSVLFLGMIANCMWFKDEEEGATDGVKIGPITLTFRQVYVGLMSSVIVVPPAFCIIEFFRRSKPRRSNKTSPKVIVVEPAMDDHESNVGQPFTNTTENKDDSTSADSAIGDCASLEDDRKTSVTGVALQVVNEHSTTVVIYNSNNNNSNGTNEDSGEQNTTQNEVPVNVESSNAEEPKDGTIESEENKADVISQQQEAACNAVVDNDMNEGLAMLQEQAEQKEELEEPKKKPKKRLRFPWFFIIFGYMLCFLCVATSGFFTLLYSLDWGKDPSLNWLLSMFFTVSQSIILIQPIKVLAIAVLLACIMRIPDDDEEMECDIMIGNPDIAMETVKVPIPEWIPDGDETIETEDLEQMRYMRKLDTKLFTTLRQMMLHLLYLTMLVIICMANRDPNFFKQNYTITTVFGLDDDTYSDVGDFASMFDWMRETVFPPLFPSKWYNDDVMDSYDRQFIEFMDGLRLGPARIRQLRVKNDQCTTPEPLTKAFNICVTEYGSEYLETNNFKEAWEPILNASSETSPEGFSYTPEEATNDLPMWGTFDVYSGGGYTVELNSLNDVIKTLDKLQEANWCDRYTRAIFIAFAINNANVNCFTMVKITIETPITGGFFITHELTSFRPYPYVNPFDFVLLLLQIIWAGLVIYFFIKEMIAIKKEKCSYFGNLGHLMELTDITLALSSMVFFVLRTVNIINAVEAVKNNGGHYVGMDLVALWDFAYTTASAFNLFLATLQLFRPLVFSASLAMLKSALKISFTEVMTYALIFLMIMFSYGTVVFSVFGRTLFGFRDMLNTFYSLFGIMLGAIKYGDVVDVKDESWASKIIFGSYTMTMNFILLNMFVSIINDTLADVKENEEKQDVDKEMNEHLMKKMNDWITSIFSSKDKNKIKMGRPPDIHVTFADETDTLRPYLERDFDGQTNRRVLVVPWKKRFGGEKSGKAVKRTLVIASDSGQKFVATKTRGKEYSEVKKTLELDTAQGLADAMEEKFAKVKRFLEDEMARNRWEAATAKVKEAALKQKTPTALGVSGVVQQTMKKKEEEKKQRIQENRLHPDKWNTYRYDIPGTSPALFVRAIPETIQQADIIVKVDNSKRKSVRNLCGNVIDVHGDVLNMTFKNKQTKLQEPVLLAPCRGSVTPPPGSEIVIKVSYDNGTTWVEEEFGSGTVLVDDKKFKVYFALINRLPSHIAYTSVPTRDRHEITPKGGNITSSTDKAVSLEFPTDAFSKNTIVYLQVQPYNADHSPDAAVSPVIYVKTTEDVKQQIDFQTPFIGSPLEDKEQLLLMIRSPKGEWLTSHGAKFEPVKNNIIKFKFKPAKSRDQLSLYIKRNTNIALAEKSGSKGGDPINDEFLTHLAPLLDSDWHILGRELGISNFRLRPLLKAGSDMTDAKKAKDMLTLWSQSVPGSQDKGKYLEHCLNKIGRPDLAEIVHEQTTGSKEQAIEQLIDGPDPKKDVLDKKESPRQSVDPVKEDLNLFKAFRTVTSSGVAQKWDGFALELGLNKSDIDKIAKHDPPYTPEERLYKVLTKWKETDRNAGLMDLQKHLKNFKSDDVAAKLQEYNAHSPRKS